MNILNDFVERATRDCRISRGHMALYLALWYLWDKYGCIEPLKLYSSEVMPIAKISSSATYHRLVKDLKDFGYIQYVPSYYKGKPSSIWLIEEVREGNEERGNRHSRTFACIQRGPAQGN